MYIRRYTTRTHQVLSCNFSYSFSSACPINHSLPSSLCSSSYHLLTLSRVSFSASHSRTSSNVIVFFLPLAILSYLCRSSLVFDSPTNSSFFKSLHAVRTTLPVHLTEEEEEERRLAVAEAPFSQLLRPPEGVSPEVPPGKVPEAASEPPVEERPPPRRPDPPGAAQERSEAREAALAQGRRVPLSEGAQGRPVPPLEVALGRWVPPLEGAQERLGPPGAA